MAQEKKPVKKEAKTAEKAKPAKSAEKPVKKPKKKTNTRLYLAIAAAVLIILVAYFFFITPYIQEGNNKLAIKVTNLWKNKIIGQSQTKSTAPNFFLLSRINNLTDTDLLPSGIWGDVKIVSGF